MPQNRRGDQEHATFLSRAGAAVQCRREKEKCLMNLRIKLLSFLWMIGIVLFHSGSNGCSSFYRELITDFRVGGVSFFFVVSGYFLMKHFQGDVYSWWKESILKRFKTLMIPYVVWCTLGLTSVNVLTQYGLTSLGPNANPPLWYVKFLYLFCLVSPLIILIIRKMNRATLIPAIVCVNLIVPCIPLPLKFSLVHSLLMFSVGIAIAIVKDRYRLNNRIQLACYFLWGLGLLLRVLLPEMPAQIKWMLNVYSSLFLVLGLWISSECFKLKRLPSWINMTFFIYCSHGIMLRYIHVVDYAPVNGIVVFCLCLILGVVISEMLPSVFGVLTGNRSQK